ncbi:MAG: hypothetical protein R3C25_01805 [Hyphomonadaceae bacterium]
MLKRTAAALALMALAGCAGRERADDAIALPPPPAVSAPVSETPEAAPDAVVAAPGVTAPAPQQPPSRPAAPSDDIVVPGQAQEQALPPQGDPRSNEERRTDVRAWDQCVSQAQTALDTDPMRPQLTTPEEYCANSLGMASRTAVPMSRQRRRP